jgi:hypothetical protein
VSTCGYSGLVRVLEHDAQATLQWQRHATAEEVDYFHHTGDLPPSVTEADVAVYACDQHGVACGVWELAEDGVTVVGTDRASQVHDAACRVPGTNTEGACSVCEAIG